MNDESLTISAKGRLRRLAQEFYTAPVSLFAERNAGKIQLSDRTAGNVGAAVVSFTVPTGMSMSNGGKIEVRFPEGMNAYMNNIAIIRKGGILQPTNSRK